MYYSQQQIHPRVYRFCKVVFAFPLCPKTHHKMHQTHYHYMKWYHVAVLTLQHGCSITSPVHSVDAAEHCTKVKDTFMAYFSRITFHRSWRWNVSNVSITRLGTRYATNGLPLTIFLRAIIAVGNCLPSGLMLSIYFWGLCTSLLPFRGITVSISLVYR